jgi:hypothetical protein
VRISFPNNGWLTKDFTVTELNNAPPIPENDNAELEPSSSRVMLISMLLLISVLILSSAMLMHYSLGGKEGDAGQKTFDFAGLIEKGKAISANMAPAGKQASVPERDLSAATQTPADAQRNGFFSGRKSTVRWPSLKLTGFGKSIDGQGGFAIINGEQILLNTTIKHALLVEILSHGVVLEYEGERKTLALDLD